MGVKLGLPIQGKKIIHGGRKKIRTSEEAKQERQLHSEELQSLYLLQILPHELKERASAGGLMSWSIEMAVVTEFASHDNLSVFEPRSGSDVLDISQLFAVARFLHLQVTPRDNMVGIPNYMSWKVSCCLLAY